MAIFDKFPQLKSPENCTGTADVGEDPIVPDSEDDKETQKVDFKYDGKYTSDEDYLSNENGQEKQQELINTYKAMIDKFKEYGCTSEDLTGADIPEAISSIDEFKEMLEPQERLENSTYL